MNRRTKWIAGLGAAGLLTLSWPSAATADSSLGGYTADSSASVIHIEVYEPVLPLPSSPQGDFSIGYTSSTADSGPTARALSSYLWPGTVIGDGFDQLTGKPGTSYPIQANSRYPATASAPAKNKVQITDGNGMTTATDGNTTTATVTGLGIAGKGVDLLGGLGAGLGQIAGKAPKPGDKTLSAPVPVSNTLAALVSAKGVTSTSTVKVSDSKVTSTSTAAAADINILGGVIGLSAIKVTNTETSNGTKATVAGSATIGGLTIAGVPISLGDKGIVIGKTAIKLPAIPATLTSLLKTLGVEIQVAPITKKVTGATSTFNGQALTISIDTHPLKDALNGPLSLLVNLLGSQAATSLAPLIELAPRVVLKLGEASGSLSASPAYVGGNGGGTTTPPSTTTGGGGGVTTTTTTGGGGGTIGGGGGLVTTPTTPMPTTTTPQQTAVTPQLQQTAAILPGLGSMPRFLILGALLLAAAIGWLMQVAGGVLLGGTRTCALGLRTGVPDLRKE
ncbi:choice-of-anchor P family protein [Jatrophihabitans sp.]|uniref:choice-of-anchor P family protein n=1 Tax=Jatrophihabitans sp. TaxID=1932789 RepID=UPI0030C744C7|nr:hypothetical protein [Jatrophihabitans sp.]